MYCGIINVERIMPAINLSILDFKSITHKSHIRHSCTINLSILDFKYIKVTLPNLQQLNPSILYSIVKYIFLLE